MDYLQKALERDFPLEICEVCGRRFYKTSQWAYKLSYRGKMRLTCSYTCYRVLEKKREKEIEANTKKKGCRKNG